MVTNPLGNSIVIDSEYRDVPLEIGGKMFWGHLLELKK